MEKKSKRNTKVAKSPKKNSEKRKIKRLTKISQKPESK